MDKAEAIVRDLPIWQGEVRMERLGGGLTNVNMLVQDDLRRALMSWPPVAPLMPPVFRPLFSITRRGLW